LLTETTDLHLIFCFDALYTHARSLQHVNRTLSSVGGTAAAACAVWEEYIRRQEHLQKAANTQQENESIQFLNEDTAHLCWGAHVAGGTHHAFKNYGEGFCIFSDIAVAANVLLQRYSSSSSMNQNSSAVVPLRRILIIDLDVHQGNGNAALFHSNTAVQTFSMHCSANYFSKKEHSDLDVELPIGCDDETYLTTLKYWLDRMEKHRFEEEEDGHKSIDGTWRKQFDLIFYQSGVDVHHQDRLGRLSLTTEGISKRNALVYNFAHRLQCPLVISMGGGYPKGDDWTSILEAHTNVYWESHKFLAENYANVVVGNGNTVAAL